MAKVLQDGSEMVTYDSSNKSVATISQNGVVRLLSQGETVISAQVGEKHHDIVLIVKNDNSSITPYTITINGGVAKNQDGEIVTSAKAGEYLTLVPTVVDHMNFVKWDYSREGLWINGNVIKMPDGDLKVTAEFSESLYKLNLYGAVAVKANLDENP